MKMTFHQPKAARKKLSLWIFSALVLVGGVIFLAKMGTLDFFSQGMVEMLGPLWAREESVREALPRGARLFSSKSDLIVENEFLKREHATFLALRTANDLLRLENEKLRAFVGRTADIDLILAAVLVRPNRSPYDTLILDRGYLDGVSVGDLVTVEGGNIALGTIIETSATKSKSKLYSSDGIELPVLVGNGGTPGVAYGQGGNNFIVELPRGVPVTEGDSVLTLEGEPRVLGVVGRVEARSSDVFDRVRFKSPVNIQEVWWVEIVRGTEIEE